MNTNMTGFGWFSKTVAFLYSGRQLASALEGLIRHVYDPLISLDKLYLAVKSLACECIFVQAPTHLAMRHVVV